jgi:uncharacterized membrane protein AbrB (regulator of aidB expression)
MYEMNSTVSAILVGTTGGALCYAAGIPAPWLAGSLIVAIAAIYTGQELDLPESLRTAAFILLGVQTGTAVNVDTLARAAQWPLSILCLAVTVGLIVWACTLFDRRIASGDKIHLATSGSRKHCYGDRKWFGNCHSCCGISCCRLALCKA